MNLPIVTTEKECPREQLAAYIDGELLAREELELEMHLAICKACAAELNEQKKLLCVLNFALENEREIELPANFTKIIVTKAESNVSGLRSSRERFKALFVCSVLFLLVLLGLGGKIEPVLNTYIKFTDQIFAVFGFVFHLIYDVSIGTAVILRSLGSGFVNDSAVVFAFFAAFLLVSLFALSRLFVRYNRA
ncbi:MAG TPA: zf-HC2 domain-containing protein [Pyrinomonadaceae bacterium]|nr:zf-HC2 domain-containing protein [Pyrinomonadaceae bacterium]